MYDCARGKIMRFVLGMKKGKPEKGEKFLPS
jgi:hypothetical protein